MTESPISIPLAELLPGVTPQPALWGSANQFRLAAWKSPGKLTESSQERLYDTLVRVSTRSFGADMTPYWRDRREGGYFSRISQFFFIVNPQGDVIGWTGYHRRVFAQRTCLYLDSTGVLPRYQGQGVISRMQSRILTWELARRPFSALYLITRTENPVIYRMLVRGVGDGRVFPPSTGETPEDIQRIGIEVAEWLGQSAIFQPAELKLVGAYSNLEALYGDLPCCGQTDLDCFFRDNLTPEDAFLVIAKANLFVVALRLLQGKLIKATRWVSKRWLRLIHVKFH